MRVLYAGSGWAEVPGKLARVLGASASVATWDRRQPLAEALRDVDVLLPSNARVDEAVLAAAPALRLIQQPAAGYEGIDVAAAARRGIPVCNAPGASHVAVAEAALMLLLLLARRWPAAQAAFARAEIGAPAGVQLAGRILGVVGPGGSGAALASRARALGMQVRLLDRGACADPGQRRAFFAGARRAEPALSAHGPDPRPRR
jgi:phosphoglycerate dehydrogenase-like enzyme